MVDYAFYAGIYLGNSIAETDFPRLAMRAKAQFEIYKRKYAIEGDETQINMALCAMADTVYYFEQTPQSLSIGGVSVTERQLDERRELYRSACRYLAIYRGTTC